MNFETVQGLSNEAFLVQPASWRSTSAELNRSLWSPAFPDLRSRLRDLFLFLLRKENNLQILAFLINNCLHLEDSIWLSKRSMFLVELPEYRVYS